MLGCGLAFPISALSDQVFQVLRDTKCRNAAVLLWILGFIWAWGRG